MFPISITRTEIQAVFRVARRSKTRQLHKSALNHQRKRATETTNIMRLTTSARGDLSYPQTRETQRLPRIVLNLNQQRRETYAKLKTSYQNAKRSRQSERMNDTLLLHPLEQPVWDQPSAQHLASSFELITILIILSFFSLGLHLGFLGSENVHWPLPALAWDWPLPPTLSCPLLHRALPRISLAPLHDK